MNKKQAMFLRILGVIIIAIGILISLYFYSNPDIKGDILTANYICKTEVGEFTQQLLQYQSECSKVNLLAFLINYNWLFYFIGFLLLIIGIWGHLGTKNRK